ncbi:MAG TPA: glutamate--tRNA ligase family protein [Thermoanaerobaculia bacterium]
MTASEWPPAPGWRTRFAPAPTGFLHLGHVANALFVWGLARAHGGRVVLRIEDHDRVRSRPEYEAALLDDLDWLGFAPDQGDPDALRRGASPFRQSDCGARYDAALARLAVRGLVYACRCSRRTIAAEAGEPAPGEEPCYPGTCREAGVDPQSTPLRRVRLPGEAVAFDDLRLGPQVQVPARQCGDLVARDRDGQWTYQFAVVVDDVGGPPAADGGEEPAARSPAADAPGGRSTDALAVPPIDVVIRGEDLLASTGRQVLLARLLGRATPPRFLHHPLLRRPDGAKLSKSSRDTGVRDLRAAGWTAERVLGEAAHRAGLLAAPRPLPAAAAGELFTAWRPGSST